MDWPVVKLKIDWPKNAGARLMAASTLRLLIRMVRVDGGDQNEAGDCVLAMKNRVLELNFQAQALHII